jgi:hypothetical protein
MELAGSSASKSLLIPIIISGLSVRLQGGFMVKVFIILPNRPETETFSWERKFIVINL